MSNENMGQKCELKRSKKNNCRPTSITFALSGRRAGAVGRLIKEGVQGPAVVLQDPVSHAPQERVMVGLNLKHTITMQLQWLLESQTALGSSMK